MAREGQLTKEEAEELLKVLETRFVNNMHRHKNLKWADVSMRLGQHPEKLWSLSQMEVSGGEPDVIGRDQETGEIIFYDCVKESPKGRRSLCYDREARESRKKFKPESSAMEMAERMGIELLNEEQYHELQKLGEFDTKTSSWIATPDDIREKGGALFGDFRFGRVFIYHNGAESYYAARGFRGVLRL